MNGRAATRAFIPGRESSGDGAGNLSRRRKKTAIRTGAAGCWALLVLSPACLAIALALNGAGLSGLLVPMLAAAAACGLGAVVAFGLHQARSDTTGRELRRKTAGLTATTGRLLEDFFQYFDGSFLLLHTVFGSGNGNETGDGRGQADARQEAENLAAALLTKTALDEDLTAKSAAAAERILAGRTDALAAVDELIAHGENVVAMLAKATGYLPDDAAARLDAYHKKIRCNEVLNGVVVSYDFYSELIHEFVASIIVDLTKSSRPLSEEILAIKENANRFVSNVNAWEKDLTDKNSAKNFANLIAYYDRQNGEFAALFKTIESNYTRLEKRLNAVEALVREIGNQSSRVQSIAENVNVLSINASIEAARAGDSGKGFKVIADEIKGLSDLTNTIIENMVKSMRDAQTEVAASVKEFSAEGEQLTRNIRGQQKEFGVFYSILNSYSDHFQSIFASVNRLIADIEVHIKRFNPLFQLHEVSVQEMENLNQIISEFLNEQRGQMNTLIEGLSEEARRSNLLKLMRDFEKKTISRFELQVLEKIVERYHFGAEMAVQKVASDIEIF
jgi:hypothetical protein